ncbi:Predicted acetyltransferase [Amycolatopsis arida]|uniref:Predicted acetyltransferase n=1 Tax=Amycolatopsis arida TaxID=587909 RepID=A0A1I5UN37_9PSEU|nr:GNAT family N-acetyltransferase [Amycolatopsis arida]TDX90965.1 putative acetyltransferase [Amycolatopsis arida]SFP96734.1 Predicted acetyltransferase [Amycolatopsis arida]
MVDLVVRPVAEGEERAVFGVLVRALRGTPPDDERWAQRAAAFLAERRFAAFAGDRPVGLTGSMPTRLTVPGGESVRTAAVDGVGVLPGYTRRGLMTRLLTEQLRDCARRGDVLAALHASEATIYGRLGYGIATRVAWLRVDRRAAAPRPDLPRAGEVRLLDPDEALTLPPALYRRAGTRRPGRIDRPAQWWSLRHEARVRDNHLVAVHRDPAGEDDGYVLYRVLERRSFDQPVLGEALEVVDLHAPNAVAAAGLWRYLLSVDLVAEIRVPGRPLDDPLPAMLADPRACQTTNVFDDLWLRLVDVPAALAARGYAPGVPVVLEVTDDQLPASTGRYRVGPDGAARTTDPPQLRLDVETLAMLYLGEWRVSLLADVGRIGVTDPAAPAMADQLFRTPVHPWCGTPF